MKQSKQYRYLICLKFSRVKIIVKLLSNSNPGRFQTPLGISLAKWLFFFCVPERILAKYYSVPALKHTGNNHGIEVSGGLFQNQSTWGGAGCNRWTYEPALDVSMLFRVLFCVRLAPITFPSAPCYELTFLEGNCTDTPQVRVWQRYTFKNKSCSLVKKEIHTSKQDNSLATVSAA